MEAEQQLRELLKRFDFDADPIIRILYSEKNILEMIDVLEKHKEITDSDEIYIISAKIANIPCKPINIKLKTYMDKWGVKERTKPWSNEE